MYPNPLKEHPKRQSLLAIFCAGIAVLAVLTPYDYHWTLDLSTHKIQGFAEFMNRSVFDRSRLPGAGDFVYPPLIVALLLYIPSWIGKFNHHLTRTRFHTFLVSSRPLLGFTMMSAFSCALLFVHTTKQIMGRARPNVVFEGKTSFSQWYQSGPEFFSHGSFTGSFPSGHTATAAITIIFAYVLLAYLAGRRRWIGWIGLALSVLFTAAMGVARMMSASHWLTDVIFTLFSEWALIHIIFFLVLKIPEQREYFRQQGRSQASAPFFELRLCLLLLLLCPGVWAFCIGIRSISFVGWSWLLALIPVGLVWSVFFLHRIRLVLSFSPPQPDREIG
jgi:membrane-associated phospholipid phosphatase